MLVFPAIVGFLCFIYGIASMNSDDNTPSKEMCDENGIGGVILCPVSVDASVDRMQLNSMIARNPF